MFDELDIAAAKQRAHLADFRGQVLNEPALILLTLPGENRLNKDPHHHADKPWQRYVPRHFYGSGVICSVLHFIYSRLAWHPSGSKVSVMRSTLIRRCSD